MNTKSINYYLTIEPEEAFKLIKSGEWTEQDIREWYKATCDFLTN